MKYAVKGTEVTESKTNKEIVFEINKSKIKIF